VSAQVTLTCFASHARLALVKALPLSRLSSRAFRRFAYLPLIISLVLSLTGSWANQRAFSAAPAAFADDSFQKLWTLTHGPVQSVEVQRSWYWGPKPGSTLNEKFAGSKTGSRLVQYFDKARMEVNDPQGDRSSEWFVTTGLLVAEMVSGKQQVGNKQYVAQRPAEIAVGGDGLAADPDAPTYTSFRRVASIRGPGDNRAPNRVGQNISATIDRAGTAGDNPALGLYSGAKVAVYNDVLGHNIPRAMWDFLNLKGVVDRNGQNVDGQTLADWIFVMGYPITEPYWARVKIGGVYEDALFQLYERRTLAYVPAMPKGWQVQMGNVGQHYYQWIYGGPLPAPIVPLATPTTAPSIPASVDAEVSPVVAPVGAPVTVAISGMRPNESIVYWFTAPDGKTAGAPFEMVAGPDGRVKNISISTITMAPGL